MMSAFASFWPYSARQLSQSLGFTCIVVLILGFSLGLSTAIYSLIDAVLLQPLPYPSSEQLVEICQPYQHHPYSVFDYPDYLDFTAAQPAFAGLAVTTTRTVDLRTKLDAQLLVASFEPHGSQEPKSQTC